MKRIVLITLFLFALAAIGPAPILDPRAGIKPTPERTQEQLTKEQALTGLSPVVGKVPVKTTESGSEVDITPSDPDAKDALATAQTMEERAAAADLVKAEAIQAQAAPKSSPLWLYLLIALLAGLGIVFVLKQWVERQIAETTSTPVVTKRPAPKW